jgi:Fe-S cluster assembly protein SufD
MSFADKIVSEFELAAKNLNGEKETSLFHTRKEALSSFQKLGIPSNRHEEWRYTNIKTQLPESLNILGGKTAVVQKNDFNSFAGIKATKLVFLNGAYSKELSTIVEEKGVTVGSLKEHLQHNKPLTEKHFNSLVKKYEEHFSVLNTAFVTDGAFVHVMKGVTAQVPVFIIHLYNSPENFSQSRNLVIAEESAKLNVIVDFQNVGSASFYNHVSEFFVGKNADVNVTKLQTATGNTTAVHTLEADVERDAKFTCTTISLEAKLIRNTTNVRLSGENSEAHLNGLYYGTGTSLIDNHILVDHLVANCQSNQLYKGILDEEATGVFNGKIFVKQDAQKTNAFQSSKAILLSDEANINSKPQLEIFADDVKCSHGAAIGQLSDDEIFYLLARGISKADAKSILTYAFASQIINCIAIDELRDYLDNKLKERLHLDF